MVFTDQHAMLAFILVGKTLLSVIEEKNDFQEFGNKFECFLYDPRNRFLELNFGNT